MKSFILRTPLLLLVFVFTLLQACKEEEEHPEVQTLQLEANSPSSATLKGNILNRGTYNIIDYGFVYGYTSDLSETRGTRVVVGQDAPEGNYEKVITGLTAPYSYYGRTVYARAFITNEKGTVFGQVSSVELPSPNISSYSPTTGKAGDRITINGNFYATSPGEVEVTFSGTLAKVVEVTPSKITVEVPTNISYTSYYNTQVPVSLRLAGQSYTVTSSFKIIPSVKDFSPKSGMLGTVVTVSGENFPTYSYYSSIRAYVGSTEVSITNYSSKSFQITIPSTITAEKAAISIVTDGVTTVLPGEFTVTPHTVSSISPSSGLAGSSFTIYGNFNGYSSYYSSNASVKIGDVTASISNITTGQMTVTVPQGATVGNQKVKVTLGPHTVEAPQQFQVLAPSITSFSPSSGSAGTEIDIVGTFIPYQTYSVYFGNIYVNAYATSANSLRVVVPSNLSGKTSIAVQFGTQKIFASDDFTVIAPSISSFSPTSGVAGSIVTLNVAGFVPGYYTSVKFGTVTTTVISYTSSTIRVAVPSNVTGAMKISVVHSGQTIVSNDNFTVTQ